MTYEITAMDACHMYCDDIILADWRNGAWIRRRCFNKDTIVNPVDENGIHVFPGTPQLCTFSFGMLKFVRDEASCSVAPDNPLRIAVYEIEDEDIDDELTISVIQGRGAWGCAERPYEIWWSRATCDPIGWLTATDVEEFINGEYWNNPEEFIHGYLQR